MSIYEEISQNKRNTFLIMFLFVVVFAGLGYILGEIFGGSGTGPFFLVFSVILSSITSIGSYFFSDKIALASAGAQLLKREQNSNLYGIVENLCVGAGLKDIPSLYIIDDSAPNAFATGRDPKHSSIAVTKGLLGKLNKRELEGVLAHELAHVRNYDIRLMAVVAVLVGSLTLVANMLLRGGFGSSDDRENRRAGGIILIAGIILALLSPLIAELIKLAVSRSREFLADASAALLTRDPDGLASALQKISSDREPLEVANEATAHMYISNPLKKGINSDWFANLFNTHPPVEERIRRLREM